MSQIYQESISVHSNLVGLVLGKNRSNLKIVEEKYNVKVYLNNGGAYHALVVKATLSNQLSQAVRELRCLVADKSDFYNLKKLKKKRYQKKLAEIRFRQKESELRKQLIRNEDEDEDDNKPKEKKRIKANLSTNPFALLGVSDSDTDSDSDDQVELPKEVELEYDLIDQSDIPPHTPTFSVGIRCDDDDSSDSESMICQKCIDEGRTSCPCSDI